MAVLDRPCIVAVNGDCKTDFGSTRIQISDDKRSVKVWNLTSMKKEDSVSFLTVSEIAPEFGVIEDVYEERSKSKDFILKKDETRTVVFTGKFPKDKWEQAGFKTFKGTFELTGV